MWDGRAPMNVRDATWGWERGGEETIKAGTRRSLREHRGDCRAFFIRVLLWLMIITIGLKLY